MKELIESNKKHGYQKDDGKSRIIKCKASNKGHMNSASGREKGQADQERNYLKDERPTSNVQRRMNE
ncbi:MAG: hypothetical protein JRK53_20525 [Deltaproteobacteria bacterium]|nr:hypothetical protein [Deltaproteobacteria bacterium]